MKAELVAKYLTTLKNKTGLTYDAIAEKINGSEATVKNLCLGKTQDPRLDTVAPIVYALGGSIDEMYNPDKSKDEVKEVSLLALKDIYEQQLSVLKETNEEHIRNIRMHYEQHQADLKENFERRLADKKEVIESHAQHIKTLKKESLITKIALGVCLALFLTILIAEVMNPNLGWLRY